MKTAVLVVLLALMIMSVTSRRVLLPQNPLEDFPNERRATKTRSGKFFADPAACDTECFSGCIQTDYDDQNQITICNSECGCSISITF